MNKMIRRLFLFFCLNSFLVVSFAQQRKSSKLLLSASSHLGNYIYLFDGHDLQDSSLLNSTDHFIIKREIVNSLDSSSIPIAEKDMKEIGIAKKPTTSKELKTALSVSGVKAMKEGFGLKKDQELIGFLQNHESPNEYFLFYPMIETRIALAHVYLDKEVIQGRAYLYAITRVDKQNNQQFWGKTIVLGKTDNYRLPFYKSLSFPAEVSDSSISFKWAVPINIDDNTLPKPAKRLSFDADGLLYNTFFAPLSIRATIELGINDKWERMEGNLFPQINTTKDTLIFSFSKSFEQGSVVKSVMTIEDELHNIGNKSDTVNAFLITKKNAPAITHLTVKDTLNGMYLHWNQLPESPYLSGIQIIRFGVNNLADTLPLLPVIDTAFIDYGIKAGVTYRYEVRALYLPGMSINQPIAANSFGTLTQFSRPFPPYSLSAANEGKNVRLKWKSSNDPTVDAFFVYRGVNPERLNLFSGRITNTTYLDTTMELNGGSQYYYAVISQNLKQDTSIYSNIVSIIPNRKLQIPAPIEMTFYYSNGALNLFWQDSRKVNNQVKSFIVEKKEKNEISFSSITPQPIEGILFKDTSTIKSGITYQYRVASVSFKGDTSEFSEVFTYALPKSRVDVINKFDLLNGPKGITVSLPTVYFDNRKAYNIFRRKEGENEFSKIASIKANDFVYEDTNVVKGVTYYYAITITENDDREGRIGMSVSIKR